MFYDAIAGTAAAEETTEEEEEEGTGATGEGTGATGEGTGATGEGMGATGAEEGHRGAVHRAEEEDEEPRNSTLTMGTGPAQTLGACPLRPAFPTLGFRVKGEG